MAPKYDLVSSIEPRKKKLRLLAKVVRKWDVFNPSNDEKPYSVELVVIDSEVYFSKLASFSLLLFLFFARKLFDT